MQHGWQARCWPRETHCRLVDKGVHSKLIMMPGIDNLPGDTTQILREILQNKDKKLNNNNNNKIKNFCASRTVENSDMIATMLRTKSSMSDSNYMETSVHSDNGSTIDSDSDSLVDQCGTGENSEELEDGKAYSAMSNGGFQGSPTAPDDSKEAKRARVENIITSMRLSPGTNSDVPSQNSLEIKRAKRKQLQPQQHDTKMGCSESKVLKIERMALQEHIRQLQQQLQVVKRRCDELCDDDQSAKTSDTEDCLDNKDINRENSGCHPTLYKGIDKKPSEQQNNAGKSDVDPTHIIEQASKLVHEQEMITKHSDTIFPSQHREIQNLADTLKSEIVEAINRIVDNAVTRLKRVRKPSPVPPKDNDREEEKTPELLFPERCTESTVSKNEQLGEFLGSRLQERVSAFEPLHRDVDVSRIQLSHHVPFPHFPYYLPTQVMPPLFTAEPEQTEPLPLVMNTPKKKRTKVTDTRLSPRAKTALLQDSTPSSSHGPDVERQHATSYPHFLPQMLPTSVAIPNPSLHHSDILGFSMRERCYSDSHVSNQHSPLHAERGSPRSPLEGVQFSRSDIFDGSPSENMDSLHSQVTSTLTPMHLRKAKLMFFYVRYPSSALLKVYFPDIKFNKNNTAQLVKWFSNFREFFYIQMEKYARQALGEGCKHPDDLVVSADSEIYRILNLHYNRNNQIEVPETFRVAIQATLREFYKSIAGAKDNEPSWKKSIYKVIARMDDTLPDFFKSANWMEQLGEV